MDSGRRMGGKRERAGGGKVRELQLPTVGKRRKNGKSRERRKGDEWNAEKSEERSGNRQRREEGKIVRLNGG